MTVTYTIQLHSYWHCGSGLSAGSDTDALVIKDRNGLPFIPGKTVKGLMKDALEDYFQFRGNDPAMVEKVFGNEEQRSEAFFSNATLPADEQAWIVQEKTAHFLYKNIAQTAIDETGTAQDHSLRRMEVVVPCLLRGTILDLQDDIVEDLSKAVGLIKGIGLNRTRGLGRCTISIEKGGNA